MNVTDTVLMVEPTHFCYNEQTAVNNVFQNKVEQSNLQVQNAASFEFTNMVEALKNVNIEVLILPSHNITYSRCRVSK